MTNVAIAFALFGFVGLTCLLLCCTVLFVYLLDFLCLILLVLVGYFGVFVMLLFGVFVWFAGCLDFKLFVCWFT